MPNAVDVTLVAALVLWAAWDHFMTWPRLMRAESRGEPGVRARLYREVGLAEWGLSAAVLAAWLAAHRPLATLGLAPPTGARLAVGAALCTGLALLMVAQSRQVAALTPERRQRAGARLSAPIRLLVPRTRAEWTGFLALSVTAGFCEELLARGFLIWFIATWTGPWIALVLSSALFGLGHGYQGWSGIVKTGVVGLVMGAVYLGTHSLLPGMVLHALIDAGSGTAGWILVRDDAQP
jgi:membrane protease YdiL (CAAX protease family)